MIRCRVKRYDPDVIEPPLQFIDLGQFECQDTRGEYLYLEFFHHCRKMGYIMKFYSISTDKNFDYDVTVL